MGLNPTVHIGLAQRERIRLLASASRDGRETGGILLGHGPDPDSVVEVAHVGDAGPGAERRSDFFLRDLAHSRRLAARAYLADGSDWIGEWHTHPTGGAEPSARDLRTYTEILTTTPGLEVFVAVILIPGCEAGGWTAPRASHWIIQLAAAEEDVIRVEAVCSGHGG